MGHRDRRRSAGNGGLMQSTEASNQFDTEFHKVHTELH